MSRSTIDISKTKKAEIVRRWRVISKQKGDTLVGRFAIEVEMFFEDMFQHNGNNGWYFTEAFYDFHDVIRLARGSFCGGSDSGAYFNFCADLHTAHMTGKRLEEFDEILMDSPAWPPRMACYINPMTFREEYDLIRKEKARKMA